MTRIIDKDGLYSHVGPDDLLDDLLEAVQSVLGVPSPADVASEAVERRLISLLEEAEGRNPAIPLKVAGPAIRLLLSDYKARGEEIERLRTEKTEAIRLVSQYAREAGFAKGKLEASELAGVVDSWREHAEAQALRIKALENENAALVAWQGNPVLEATIAAQGERIVELVDAANVALGHLTGGMDGDWRDCDPAELLRTVLSPEDRERITALNAPAKEDTDHG